MGMKIENAILAIMRDLANNILYSEDEFEQLLNNENSSLGAENTINEAKRILNNIVLAEASLAKFTKMVTNNTKLKTETNGKV